MEKTNINIAVIGKSGVGKSSFCNYIFDDEYFDTGEGQPVTGWEDNFKYYSSEHQRFTLNVYDSVGIEPDNYKKWKSNFDGFLRGRSPNGSASPMEWLHTAIYLINAASDRIEEIEIGIIKSLRSYKIPVHIVFTHCDNAKPSDIGKLRDVIQSECKGVFITEVCSVSINKRSGESSQRYGKEEALGYILSNLDVELRNSIICYALELMIDTTIKMRDETFKKIDDSDLGLINIIKGAIREGDDFNMDKLLDLNSFDDIYSVTEASENILDGLEDFLMDLGFHSKYKISTHKVFSKIREQIQIETDAIGYKMDGDLERMTDAFDGDSTWEKVKAAKDIAVALINLKKFLKKMLGKCFDSLFLIIEGHKERHTSDMEKMRENIRKEVNKMIAKGVSPLLIYRALKISSFANYKNKS